MNLLRRLIRFVSPANKMERLYQQAIERAKRHDLACAIADYSLVIEASATPLPVRAMALVNRAKAYAALKSLEKAHADLIAVMAIAEAPAAVRDAAQEKIHRLKRAAERAGASSLQP